MRPSSNRLAGAAFAVLLLVSSSFLMISCGGSAISPASATAPSPAPGPAPAPASPAPGPTNPSFSNLQKESGWTGYALLPAAYSICSSCTSAGPEATWSMTQQVATPSMTGSSSQMDIGGQTAFSDILWNNHLIGDGTSQGMPDNDHSIISGLHNFTYDVYFFSTNIGASQALEFDINQFVGGQSFIWGHECRIAGGNEWDIWDNQNQKWLPTGVACNPTNNAWNHLTIQVQRTAQNQLLFQSITLNGQTAAINHTENPTSSGWHGVTVNYQQDGNRMQEAYTVWLDKLTFSYW